jgi:hypothetical protein
MLASNNFRQFWNSSIRELRQCLLLHYQTHTVKVQFLLASGGVFLPPLSCWSWGTDTSVIGALTYVLIWDIWMNWCCDSWRVSVNHRIRTAAPIHVIFVFWFGQKWHYICLLPCYFGVFLSSCIDTYLLAFLEILSEIQMTGLQSYLKGRLQMGIWSVYTMAGNLMVPVLASKSHRSNLHSECKHEIPTYNLFVSTHVDSMNLHLFWGISLSYLRVLKTTWVSADFDALVAQFSFLKAYADSHSWVNFVVGRQLSCWWEWLTKCVWIMVLVAVGTWCKNTKGCMHPTIWSARITGSNMGVAFTKDARGSQEASLVWTLCKGGVSA